MENKEITGAGEGGGDRRRKREEDAEGDDTPAEVDKRPRMEEAEVSAVPPKDSEPQAVKAEQVPEKDGTTVAVDLFRQLTDQVTDLKTRLTSDFQSLKDTVQMPPPSPLVAQLKSQVSTLQSDNRSLSVDKRLVGLKLLYSEQTTRQLENQNTMLCALKRQLEEDRERFVSLLGVPSGPFIFKTEADFDMTTASCLPHFPLHLRHVIFAPSSGDLRAFWEAAMTFARDYGQHVLYANLEVRVSEKSQWKDNITTLVTQVLPLLSGLKDLRVSCLSAGPLSHFKLPGAGEKLIPELKAAVQLLTPVKGLRNLSVNWDNRILGPPHMTAGMMAHSQYQLSAKALQKGGDVKGAQEIHVMCRFQNAERKSVSGNVVTYQEVGTPDMKVHGWKNHPNP